MRTALDMAQRLKQPSLLQVAAEVALLNHVVLPKPVSLLAVMKLFANIAKPEMPANLVNNFDFPTTSPTLSPIFSEFSWTDPGAKTFRHASRYRCRLSLGYGSGYADIGGDADVWANSTNTVFEIPLNFDTDYKAAVFASNDWGDSDWVWIKFHTYDNPNPPNQPPPQHPPPAQQPTYSGILFWNCDVTSVDAGDVQHQPVYFWFTDVTAATSYHQLLDPGYNDAGSCGATYTDAQVIIPSSNTTSIVAGHHYLWQVVKPTSCASVSGMPNPDCVVRAGTFVAGGNTPLIIQWTNT